MSKVHETRQSIDHQLDVWETKAAALEAQINLNREKGAARLQAAKQDLRNKLDAFKNQLENVPTLAEEKKQAVMDKLENLQVQLALGKAWKQKIHTKSKKRRSRELSRHLKRKLMPGSMKPIRKSLRPWIP